MNTVYLGVDIAKKSFVAALWQAGQAQSLGEFPNTPAGFAQFVAAVGATPTACDAARFHLVLEPTGGYELALALFLHQAGWQVSRPNPRQVRDFAKGLGRRAKTDRQDALVLAHYAAERKPSRWAPLPSEVSELESLLSRRQELEQMLGQERRRQEALSGRPHVARGVGGSLQGMIDTLTQQLEHVEAAIAAHLKEHPHLKEAVRRLRSVPGVGARNVLWLLVLLWRWQTLTGGEGLAKGLVAFAGLDPRTHESGTSVRGRATISRMGDRRIRPSLYMGALGGVKGNNALRAFYQGLVARGKAKKLALVAAARKILVWAWAVFRDRAAFRAPNGQAAGAASA